jgi:carbon storage regulator
MLVLSRTAGETIVITAPDGTRIVLMLVEVRGDKSRIGINAPVTYTIHRGEIQDAIDAEAGV